MSGLQTAQWTMGEFDAYGFVSQGGHALAECLDAAGIDGQREPDDPDARDD